MKFWELDNEEALNLELFEQVRSKRIKKDQKDIKELHSEHPLIDFNSVLRCV